mmetsp:Transcript_24329/g.72531  ORF Transcript_24329/g.72531 Transcript_24329/m.72531 type:complete len:522 (+) Transcript_24329:97-1662(+)
MPELLVRLLLGLLFVALRAQFYPLLKLMGYRRFEPQQGSVLVACCTNGLGHLHQMERVLAVLEEAGVDFPVIALAKEKKVPSYKLVALKHRFPHARFVDLDFEVDYDNGKSFKNSAIVWNAAKTACTRSVQLSRKVAALFKQYRPAYCLSFWEPAVASIINVMNAPTRLIAVASQGQIYRDSSGDERGLLMRGLHQLCVGPRGTLVPLSVLPMEGAIPQIVSLPPAAPLLLDDGGFYVAYTTVPQVLSPLKSKLAGRRVLLFVKEKRLAYYTAKYKRYPHVTVQPASPRFAHYLARSRGLIATPSRGVVTQALAVGKPVYLFCPRGHLEQEYNLRFYLKHFAAVTSPRTRRYRRLLRVGRAGTLPSGWQGRLESLAEWDAGHAAREGARASQGRTLSEWLSQTDELIAKRLLPLLTPAPADAAAGEAAAAAGRGGGAAAERAASGGAASPAGPSPGAASPLASPVAPWVEEALRGGAVAAEGGTGAEEEADEDEGEDEDEDEEADEGDEDKGEGGARGHGA